MNTPRLRIGPVEPTAQDLTSAHTAITTHIRNHGYAATTDWLIREIGHALLCVTSPGGASESTVRWALALRQVDADGGGRS